MNILTSPCLFPSNKNCKASVVLRVPGSPSTSNSLLGGKPPRTIASRPSIPVLTTSWGNLGTFGPLTAEYCEGCLRKAPSPHTSSRHANYEHNAFPRNYHD